MKIFFKNLIFCLKTDSKIAVVKKDLSLNFESFLEGLGAFILGAIMLIITIGYVIFYPVVKIIQLIFICIKKEKDVTELRKDRTAFEERRRNR